MRWVLAIAATVGLAAWALLFSARTSNASRQAATAAAARAKLDALDSEWEKLKTPPSDRAAVLLLVDDSDDSTLKVNEGLAAGLGAFWRRTMTLESEEPPVFDRPRVLPVRAESLVQDADADAQTQALENLMRTAVAYGAGLRVVTRGGAAAARAFAAAAAVAAEGAQPRRYIVLAVPTQLLPQALPEAPEGFVAAWRSPRGEPVIMLRNSTGGWDAAPDTTFAGDDPVGSAVDLALQPQPVRLYALAPAVSTSTAAAPPPRAAPSGPTAADLAPRKRQLQGLWKGWLDWSGHHGEFTLDLSSSDAAGRAEGQLVLAGPGGTQRGALGVTADITGGVVTETLPVQPRMKCQGQLMAADKRIEGSCWSSDGPSYAFRLDRL